MIEIVIEPVSTQIPAARHRLRARLADDALGAGHAQALESVAGELLGAALDGRLSRPLTLRVETFARLTSVRVRCASNVELRDEPFGLRERVLEGFAFAWGKRSYADGSVDLWAEVARPAGGRRAGP